MRKPVRRSRRRRKSTLVRLFPGVFLTDIFRLPRRATAPNAARDTRELARETTRVTAARAGTSHPGLHPDFAIGSTSVSAPQSARRLPTQHPKMLTRVARACAAREAAALRPAVLESARGQFGMCTEAFVGFSGARDPTRRQTPCLATAPNRRLTTPRRPDRGTRPHPPRASPRAPGPPPHHPRATPTLARIFGARARRRQRHRRFRPRVAQTPRLARLRR